ncbi:MAG: acyl-CoA dehydrogenase [Bacteroidota bacterium]|nr:acyl-CoA dehydrogenase [Bacteroidota bacterium]
MAETLNVSALAEQMRERSHQWSNTPTLPPDIVDLLVNNRLFKLFVPAELGGWESNLEYAAHIYAELGAADGSIGWLVQIGSGGGFFVPSFHPSIAEELFGPSTAVVAGSGYPTGRARKVVGGYIVRGQWKYASGAQYASVFTANAVVEETGAIRAFAFRPEQVELVHDWHAMGMRATSSWTFRVHDVFVPEELSFVVGEKVWEPAGTVYNVPFLTFAIVSMGAVSMGLARAFFAEAIAVLSDAPERTASIAEYHQKSQTAEETFFALVRQVENRATGRGVEQALIEQQLLQSIHQQRMYVLEAVPYCGMRIVDEQSRLNRILRDMMVLYQHEILRPRMAVEVPGVEPGSEVPVA